jgi:hypothetical protein
MNEEQKNSINITVNGDAQKQIDKYTKSFEDLRNSLNNLSQPFNSVNSTLNNLDKNLSKYTASLNELNNQNKELSSSSEKADNKISDLSSSFTTWAGVIEIIIKATKTWTVALTGGLAIVTTFLPEIINFAKALFKGKDAIDQAKLSLDSLNKGLGSSEFSNANKQFTELRINIGLAKKGLLEKKDVLNQYNETIGKTMGHANSLNEAENKMIKDGPAYIKMTLYKATAQLALQDAAKKAYEAEQIKLKPDDEVLTFWDKVEDVLNRNAGAAGTGAPGIPNVSAQADKDKKAKASKRRFEAVQEAERERNTFETIANNYQKLGAELSKKFNMDFFDNGENTIKPHSYIPRTTKPKPTTPHGEALIAAQSITITQHFENEKKAYDNELALLNDQIDKKLISQAQYNTQSQALQEQYHQGIESSLKAFAEKDMDATVKHLKDVAEAEGKLKYDENNVKKAILPGQKLDAEKQLITDKYNYEIVLANGNAEKIKELEIKKQEALTSVTQQYEQQRKEFALNTAQQVADKAFSIIGNNIKASSDAKIKGLEKDKAGELSNKNLTETQRKAIEDKYKKKEDQEKLKAFKAEQRMSVLQAVVNGALAVTKATAQTGVLAPFVIPGIIASTALQIATIVAQKPPAFAKGGRFVSDGRGALLPGYSRTDNTNAYLRSGEAVVVSEAMRNPWARNLVSAINVAHGGRDFSMPNTGRGYAIGGIFTDGGNANRYYNQPVNDMKDMANTLAYQMINNFPPIYVDVKDVNNQQNILAQTVNRVNL